MEPVLVAIHSTLTSDGAEDIDLIVHSHNVGNPSPCAVIKDGLYQCLIGGNIDSLDEILQLELNKHPGCRVKVRTNIVAIPKFAHHSADFAEVSGDVANVGR